MTGQQPAMDGRTGPSWPAARIDPKKKQELIVRVQERNAGKLEHAVLGAIDRGLWIFERAGPAERLRYFEALTLPEDRSLILDPEYPRAMREGTAPPLMAEAVRKAWVMMQDEAKVMGEPPPQDIPPYAFWALLAVYQPGFEKVVSDFRSLARAAERDWERQTAMMTGGMM